MIASDLHLLMRCFVILSHLLYSYKSFVSGDQRCGLIERDPQEGRTVSWALLAASAIARFMSLTTSGRDNVCK